MRQTISFSLSREGYDKVSDAGPAIRPALGRYFCGLPPRADLDIDPPFRRNKFPTKKATLQ